MTNEKSKYFPDPRPIKMIKVTSFGLGVPSKIMNSTLPIGVYLAIEKYIEDSKEFLKPFGVLNVGIMSMIGLQMTIGIFSYWYYGINTRTPDFLFDGVVVGKALILGEVFAVVISFCVHGYCTVTIIWNELIKPFVKTKRHTYIFMALIRFIISVMVCMYWFSVCLRKLIKLFFC